VHLADGDHPAYTAPKKGDVLADDSNAQFIKIDGAWYVLDPDNAEKCWYTSKEPSTWQTVKQTTDAVIENVVATKDDILNFKEQKDINYAKNQLLAQGITEDDPEYEAEFAEKYKNAKEQSDAVWGFALGEGAGNLVSAFAKLKAFKYTASAIEGSSKAEVPQKVIGHYPEYVEMSNKLGTKPFSIPDEVWNKKTEVEQWAANQKFLDRAIAKGAEFNLATPIDKVRPGSYLQKEIEYLTSKGYKFNEDGTKLIK